MNRFFTLVLLSLTVLPFKAYSYSLRCNKKQSQCQVKTRRLTIGDYVGVFGDDLYLQAVGKVTKIVGSKRVVKITKKFSLITADSNAKRIEDREANKPNKYFKIKRKEKISTLSAAGGVAQIGLGDGFVGLDLRVQYSHLYRPNIFLVLTGNYFFGEGIATDNLSVDVDGNPIGETSLGFSSIGIMGGAQYQLLSNSPVNIRLGVNLGLSNATVTLAEGEVSEALRGRAKSGIGLQMSASALLVYRTKSTIEPFVGFDYLVIQSSQNPVAMFGLMGTI